MPTAPSDPVVRGVEVRWTDHLFAARQALSAARYVPRLPKARLEDLFPGIEDLTISLRHEVHGRALMHAEAYVLSLITAYLHPSRIFEIGTASGQGTLLMARQAPGARVDTLDLGSARASLGTQRGEPPWTDVESIGFAYKESEHRDSVVQHLGDSATFDYRPFERAMDLVFVDGAHTVEYVRTDSRKALSISAPGATIVWDDCNYTCPGVAKALLELRREGKPIYRPLGTRFAVMRVDRQERP